MSGFIPMPMPIMVPHVAGAAGAGGPPLWVFVIAAACIVVGVVGGAIYGAMYPQRVTITSSRSSIRGAIEGCLIGLMGAMGTFAVGLLFFGSLALIWSVLP